jgi:hypothetical protein
MITIIIYKRTFIYINFIYNILIIYISELFTKIYIEIINQLYSFFTMFTFVYTFLIYNNNV